MKKKFAGVLAALLVLAMGTTTALAAPSIDAAEEYKKFEAAAAELNEKKCNVTVKAGNSILDVKTEAVKVEDYIAAEGGKQKNTDKIVAMQDITGVKASGSVTITLEVDLPKLEKGQVVYVMHKPESGGWEYYDVKVSNGQVTVTMDSFSPVYVVVGDAPVNNGGNSGSSGGSYPVYYPVYVPSTGGSSGGNTGGNTTTQPGDSNKPSGGNTGGSDDNGSYDDGYSSGYGDGYEAGRDDAKEEFENNNSDSDNSSGNDSNTNNSNGNDSASGTGTNTGTGGSGSGSQASTGGVVTAPKTGASLPALPFVAVFAAAGIALCGKKARKSDE